MADYQNLWTQVQVRTAPDWGPPIAEDTGNRVFEPTKSYWLGKIGDWQVGPVYLGWTGVASLIFGVLSFNIIGFNYLAQVNWNAIEFVRQLPWLSLDPPAPGYGLSIPPMAEGGWWLLAGFFLTISVMLWWVRLYQRARAHGMGTHLPWAFASAIWLFLVLGFFRPLLMGSWARRCPSGSSRTSTGPRPSASATGTCSTTRSTCCRSPSCMARRCCSPCTAQRSSPRRSTARSEVLN